MFVFLIGCVGGFGNNWSYCFFNRAIFDSSFFLSSSTAGVVVDAGDLDSAGAVGSVCASGSVVDTDICFDSSDTPDSSFFSASTSSADGLVGFVIDNCDAGGGDPVCGFLISATNFFTSFVKFNPSLFKFGSVIVVILSGL